MQILDLISGNFRHSTSYGNMSKKTKFLEEKNELQNWKPKCEHNTHFIERILFQGVVKVKTNTHTHTQKDTHGYTVTHSHTYRYIADTLTYTLVCTHTEVR